MFSETQFYSHIVIDENGERVQTVNEHLQNVARLTSELLSPLKLGKIGYLIGLLHDMGKYSADFQKYLRKSTHGEFTARGSVIHSTQGMRYLFEYKNADPYQTAVIELCGFVIASHHGLTDCVDEENESVLLQKIDNLQEDLYEECRQVFEYFYPDVKTVLQDAVEEFRPYLSRMQSRFHLGLLARTVLSALIEADHSDTADFMLNRMSERLNEQKIGQILKNMSQNNETSIEKLQANAKDTPLNRVRKDISLQCLEKAKLAGGIYRLSVPTGAGKTRASMRYALNHCVAQNKIKIYYIAPLLTVLDQNADEICEMVGEENKDYVLEHTSDILKSEFSEEESERYECLTKSWESPVIVTTLVQFLDTLFAGKARNIRRFHSLMNSVIILDEVQSVPLKMTNLFNEAINYLAKICHSTVILCSATQPQLNEKVKRKNTQENFLKEVQDDGELVMLTAEQKEVFRRTQIVDKTTDEGYSIDEAVEFISSLNDEKSILLICNTKKDAARIYENLQNYKQNYQLYHLSAGMCKAHRNDVLEKVNASLKEDEKTILISTQVVEAGVDISFDCVVRVLAGVDNIVQASGRCNRHGEKGKICKVYTIRLKDESLRALKEIEKSQIAAVATLKGGPGEDLSSDESVKYYYSVLYQSIDKKYLNYSIKALNGKSIYGLLDNGFCAGHTQNIFLKQAFKTAAKYFKVFYENTITVITPYNEESRKLYAELLTDKAQADFKYAERIIERLKPYTVSLFDYQKDKINENGGLIRKQLNEQTFYYLNEDFYGEMGVMEESIYFKGGI